MKKAFIASIFLFFAVMVAMPVFSGELADVTMADTLQVGESTVTLTGMGIRTKTFLKVKVYVAGLYMENPSKDPQKIITEDETKRLFIQGIGPTMKAKAIKEALWAGFDANTPDRTEDLQKKMETVANYFTEPAQKGDTFGFTYEPGTGTTVTIKGEKMPAVPGKDLMEAVFAIWFGDQPADKGLKKSVLKGLEN
jgi:hypothetical protein